ncbi:MAG: TIGR03618 family F420-dependent PPOX class oxidoreductase [Ardenticatenaceae bacterium]|nr:TIGR03618 family F420-dependent PPOX class oxidoreductase [Ardenticatenaceae bacterium]
MATSDDRIEEFLSARRHAIVGTNPIDGPPQLSPVWYLWEEGRLYLSVNVETAKYRNLQRDPRITVCIDGCYPDMRSVIITGMATLVGADNPLQAEMRRRLLGRYYDSEEGVRRHLERTPDSPKMALVVVRPEKIIRQGFE